MKQYKVTGMTCAACQARVEKVVQEIHGVESCSVSLLTNSMVVKGTVDNQEIMNAVKAAGYGIRLADGSELKETDLEENESLHLFYRFLYSLLFLFILMYLSMGVHMLHLPVPSFLEGQYVSLALLQMLLSAVVMIINYPFYIRGTKALLNLNPNMDSLVALGSFVSFAWSFVILFQMTFDSNNLMHLYHQELYFESAAMIPTLITVGKALEAHAKGKTTNALKSLMKLAPKMAIIEKNGVESIVDVSEVRVGDMFIVKPGDRIPVDGIVVEGESAVDESSLTGESIPVDKEVNDKVSAATMNQSGYLKCKATRVGEDTTLSQIIQMVSDAASTKAPIARKADQVSAVFVPVVITISLLTLIGWLVVGKEPYFALARAISVLVISCPCALGLATPVAIMVGNGLGAKNGILFKSAEALETAGQTEVVILDKTGTITEGKPIVTDILANSSHNDLLSVALSLESKSEHPLAQAVVAKAIEESSTLQEVTEFKAEAGNGISARVNGKMAHAGNERYIQKFCTIDEKIVKQAKEFSEQGKTVMYFVVDGNLIGIIAAADVVKSDSADAIHSLKKMGISVAMLTGDNEKTAHAIAKQVGIDKVYAQVLPAQKESVVRDMKSHSTVMMVGDGINDAPALTTAQIGVAIGAGTDVAIEAADVVLIQNRLTDIPALIQLSRYTVKNIKENLFWAFFYNVICIPLAIGLFTYKMNPMLGALAMSLSSFTVVMNALRINFFHLHQNEKTEDFNLSKSKEYQINVKGMMCGHCEASVKKALETIDGLEVNEISYKTGIVSVSTQKQFDIVAIQTVLEKAGYQSIEKEKNMKKTVRIEGMMCSHCSLAVKEALESIAGISEANVSHEKKIAEITLTKEVPSSEIQKVIEDKGYQFVGIE